MIIVKGGNYVLIYSKLRQLYLGRVGGYPWVMVHFMVTQF